MGRSLSISLKRNSSFFHQIFLSIKTLWSSSMNGLSSSLMPVVFSSQSFPIAIKRNRRIQAILPNSKVWLCNFTVAISAFPWYSVDQWTSFKDIVFSFWSKIDWPTDLYMCTFTRSSAAIPLATFRNEGSDEKGEHSASWKPIFCILFHSSSFS